MIKNVKVFGEVKVAGVCVRTESHSLHSSERQQQMSWRRMDEAVRQQEVNTLRARVGAGVHAEPRSVLAAHSKVTDLPAPCASSHPKPLGAKSRGYL